MKRIKEITKNIILEKQKLVAVFVLFKNKYLLKLSVAFYLALILTVFLYWPVYQNISLENIESNIDQEISRLDLVLEEDIKEILNRTIQLPKNRHELCLKNKNGFQFIHTDSNSPGVPFIFYTNDLNQHDYGKVNKLAAMGISFSYKDTSSEVLLYREFGWPRDCAILETEKLKNYASSTIEYSYVGLKQLEEFDLGEQGKLKILRSIAAGYFIDTSKSSVYIIARWEFFVLTLVTLFGILFAIIKSIFKKSKALEERRYNNLK